MSVIVTLHLDVNRQLVQEDDGMKTVHAQIAGRWRDSQGGGRMSEWDRAVRTGTKESSETEERGDGK